MSHDAERKLVSGGGFDFDVDAKLGETTQQPLGCSFLPALIDVVRAGLDVSSAISKNGVRHGQQRGVDGDDSFLRTAASLD